MRTTTNQEGKEVEAIPLSKMLLFREQCYCGRKFFKKKNYRAHYALAHILKLPE